MKQATKHPEPREREYCSGSYDRRPHSRALPANHPNQKISTEPMVNPFDQFSDGTSHHSRATLGYHTSHSVPSMIESETSESDDFFTADEFNKQVRNHEQDKRQQGSNALNENDYYRHGQQQPYQPSNRTEKFSDRYSSSNRPPVQYKQPPQLHQQPSLKTPPSDLASPAPATAVSRSTRGALLRNCNFSFKLLEVAPGEHMRLRGMCGRDSEAVTDSLRMQETSYHSALCIL